MKKTDKKIALGSNSMRFFSEFLARINRFDILKYSMIINKMLINFLFSIAFFLAISYNNISYNLIYKGIL